MMKQHTNHSKQRGFTLIELMIATAILSTILLLTTAMLINIGGLYYKGINQARVQDDVRNITDEISQHLELVDKGAVPAPTPIPVDVNGTDYEIDAYCIASVRYSYLTGVQIGGSSTQIPHVLWRDTITAGGNCIPAKLTQTNPSAGTGGSNGTELIAPNSRLTYFSISPTSPYTISIAVAFGDDDLLNVNGLNTKCKGAAGDQYCSTAELTTVVGQRISSD
jgi:prepilin-type N-terminal cleavage/methylation domain-containing protein